MDPPLEERLETRDSGPPLSVGSTSSELTSEMTEVGGVSPHKSSPQGAVLRRSSFHSSSSGNRGVVVLHVNIGVELLRERCLFQVVLNERAG